LFIPILEFIVNLFESTEFHFPNLQWIHPIYTYVVLIFPSVLTAPVGAMHHTNKIFKEGFRLCNLANIVSVKIVSSDYGYPFNVYGTVIARDSLDRQCVYIFQRGEDNCQFISSKVIFPDSYLNENRFHVFCKDNSFVGGYRIIL
jgi:hypothetical protein